MNHIHFFLKNGESGWIVGGQEDTAETLLQALLVKYGDRLDVDKTTHVEFIIKR